MLNLLHYPFMRNALAAGSIVAVLAAFVGYFIVARSLTFAAHAIPNIGFAGAAGAVLAGMLPVYGFFAFALAAAVGIGIIGARARERDIVVAVLMTFALGLGFLFLSLYSGYAQRVYGILFGSILGISVGNVLVTGAAAVLDMALLLAIYRPLLLCTIDPQAAAARGLSVSLLSALFLAVAALAISLSAQMMGSLLVFTLLVGPAATANRLTKRPGRTIAIAALLGLAYVWVGIGAAALSGRIPVSFAVSALAFAAYLPVRLVSSPRRGRGTGKRRREAPAEASGCSTS
jgi:zinc/manganese transport system permease protein